MLATQENAELHIIHAWQLPGEDYLKGSGCSSEIERCEMAMDSKEGKNTWTNS
jgi:universal stress protein E